jgi:hypothetical protein
MLKKLLLVPLAFAMAAATPVSAHEGENHDHAQEEAGHDHDPKHGGVVVHSGHHHLELVVNGANVELFVRSEEGGDEDVAAAKAQATLLVDGKAEQVALQPAGASLKGVRNSSEGKVATAVVSLTMPGHETEQARFLLD